jgi:hypothetical protein
MEMSLWNTLIKKLVVAGLLRNFLVFHETRSLITVFTIECHFSRPGQMNSGNILQHFLFKSILILPITNFYACHGVCSPTKILHALVVCAIYAMAYLIPICH